MGKTGVTTFHTYGELAAQHLTGRTRGRAGWFGKLVMQVEVKSPWPRYPKAPRQGAYDPWSEGSYLFWRDATVADLQRLAALGRGGCDLCGHRSPDRPGRQIHVWPKPEGKLDGQAAQAS
jgi:hypothetical protein